MIKEMELISIVVPVYNVKEFLSKCVDSILNQTYKTLEVILVNDGSTDGSGDICDSYFKLDNRVRVIHKENGGLSSARNVGIENSFGKYICFIDSDDIIDKNFIKYHYESIESTNSDMSICLLKRFFNEVELRGSTDLLNIVELNQHDLILKLFQKNSTHYVCACTKMYKKEIFENLNFDVGRLHEDEFIVYRIFNAVKKAVFINLPLYFYRGRTGSITKSTTFKKKNLDAFYSMESCYKFYLNTQYKNLALNRLINGTAYIYCIARKRKADKEILDFLINQFRKYYKINKHKTLKQRIFNFSPALSSLIKNITKRS